MRLEHHVRHALCWIHAERNIQSLLPFNDIQAKQLAWVRSQLWDLYHDLKHYKLDPNPEAKLDIEERAGAVAVPLRCWR